MHLIGIEVSLHLHEVTSLKGKRSIIKSILNQIQHQYKVSVAEVDLQGSLSKSKVGFGIATGNLKNGQALLQKIINFIDIQSEVEIIKIEWIEA